MAITANDILNPNKEERNDTLFGQYGMDWKGKNEGAAWLRRLGQLSGVNAAEGMAFRNSLEPERQGAIRAGIALADPANMVGNAKAQGEGLMRQGTEQGMTVAQFLEQAGMGEGAQAGALVKGANEGVRAANTNLMRAYSPEEQAKAMQIILNYIQQSGGQGLEEVMRIFQAINSKVPDDKGGGLLGGVFGDLLGAGLSMIPGGGAVASAVGGGGGSDVSSGMPGQVQPNLNWLSQLGHY